MNFCFQTQSSKNADRLVRMRTLISQDHCRSAIQGPGWTALDRFLHRGLRMFLFHRDLMALRSAARHALRRDLDADGDLTRSPFQYLQIEWLIWMLRWKSVLFVFGFAFDPVPVLEKLMTRPTQVLR